METLAHFQSDYPQFVKNCTLAHHTLTRAVVAYLKDMQLKYWTFFYETDIKDLPFEFTWASEAEAAEQRDQRPDGVAWNWALETDIFLEFT